MKFNHPIITKEKQKIYEAFCKDSVLTEYCKNDIPCICGYYGRACRHLNEEANTMLCNGCTLYKLAATLDEIIKRCDEKQRIGLQSLYDSDIMDIEGILDRMGLDADYSYINAILDFLIKCTNDDYTNIDSKE